VKLIDRYRYRGAHRIVDIRLIRPRLQPWPYAVFWVNPEGARRG
jgi:hypothetical protein